MAGTAPSRILHESRSAHTRSQQYSTGRPRKWQLRRVRDMLQHAASATRCATFARPGSVAPAVGRDEPHSQRHPMARHSRRTTTRYAADCRRYPTDATSSTATHRWSQRQTAKDPLRPSVTPPGSRSRRARDKRANDNAGLRFPIYRSTTTGHETSAYVHRRCQGRSTPLRVGTGLRQGRQRTQTLRLDLTVSWQVAQHGYTGAA